VVSRPTAPVVRASAVYLFPWLVARGVLEPDGRFSFLRPVTGEGQHGSAPRHRT